MPVGYPTEHSGMLGMIHRLDGAEACNASSFVRLQKGRHMKTLLSSRRFLSVATLAVLGASLLVGKTYLIAAAQACPLLQ